ncbi:hypothetical protein ACOYW6_04065 [Parablastomonas sp. CN1-191]|uniref:hypothetical protein n=1 Tax=Parablastomonas sp. CN1-191 TaxID=3400908 RepID=UPI003BF7D5D0
MNDWATVGAIVASLGWLLLAFGAYRARGQTRKTTLLHAGLWILIIATVAVIAANAPNIGAL